MVGLVLIGLWLAGCTVPAPETSVNRQVNDYEASLRSEADWLWNNMNYARLNAIPAPGWCTDEQFDHHAVQMTDPQRADNPTTAGCVDHLVYAAARIKDARDIWDAYCAQHNLNPGPNMEAQLRAAYTSLNTVRLAQLPNDPTPAPGST